MSIRCVFKRAFLDALRAEVAQASAALVLVLDVGDVDDADDDPA